MDRSKILEEIRLKSLTVNKYIKENAAPVMVSPAAAAGASGAGGGKTPTPTPPEPTYPVATDEDVVNFLAVTGISNETLISTALETMVTSLKGDSIWVYMKGLYPFVTDETNDTLIKDQFKVNLKDRKAGNFLTEGGETGVTVSANGVTDLGATGHYRTPVSLSNGFSGNFPGVGYCKTTNTDTNETIISSNPKNYFLNPQSATTLGYKWDTAESETELTGLASKGVIIGSSYLNPEETYALRFMTPANTTVTEVVETRTGTTLDANLYIGDPAGATDTNVISTFFYFDAVNMTNTDLQNLYGAIKQFNIDLGRL